MGAMASTKGTHSTLSTFTTSILHVLPSTILFFDLRSRNKDVRTRCSRFCDQEISSVNLAAHAKILVRPSPVTSQKQLLHVTVADPNHQLPGFCSTAYSRGRAGPMATLMSSNKRWHSLAVLQEREHYLTAQSSEGPGARCPDSKRRLGVKTERTLQIIEPTLVIVDLLRALITQQLCRN